ncbi:hypothetical protein FJZ39_03375 [Candidatus Saccharibacteria bacterium]|nr:hypothetical protein [Candidatus Saccharibacteria bacterium]
MPPQRYTHSKELSTLPPEAIASAHATWHHLLDLYVYAHKQFETNNRMCHFANYDLQTTAHQLSASVVIDFEPEDSGYHTARSFLDWYKHHLLERDVISGTATAEVYFHKVEQRIAQVAITATDFLAPHTLHDTTADHTPSSIARATRELLEKSMSVQFERNSENSIYNPSSEEESELAMIADPFTKAAASSLSSLLRQLRAIGPDQYRA